jgi:hypothetical protein
MNVMTLTSSLKKPIFYHNLTIVFENEKNLWQNIPFSDNCVSFRQIFTFKKMELWPIQFLSVTKTLSKSKFPKAFARVQSKLEIEASTLFDQFIIMWHVWRLIWSAHWWCIEHRRLPVNSRQNSSMDTFCSSGPETVPGTGDQPMWPQGQ